MNANYNGSIGARVDEFIAELDHLTPSRGEPPALNGLDALQARARY